VIAYPVRPTPIHLGYSSSSTSPTPNWATRILALDGLRGIAILLVLSRHSIFGMETGSTWANRLLALGRLSWSGVDLFFVLSGFLIGGILLDARESPRYYTTFYARRAYRILPLYFAITFLFLLHHLPLRVLPAAFGESSPLNIPWLSYLTFTQSFFMIHLGWYGPAAMAVTWSLAVEEQFYLVTPLMIRKFREKRLVAALLFIIIGAPFLRLLLRHVLIHGDFACYVLMPCRADALCLGVLIAYMVRRPAFWNGLIVRRKLLWSITGILFVGVAFMTWRNYQQLSLPMTTWGYSWLALFYACCLLISISSFTGVWHWILCSRWLRHLGTLAYCSYLLHYPLIQAGRRVFHALLPSYPAAAWLIGGLSAVALTLVLAALSWRYFEKPMLRRGHKYQYFPTSVSTRL
jgi:peptidoglycan/LPS O-acetylase OafA/YrhL